MNLVVCLEECCFVYDCRMLSFDNFVIGIKDTMRSDRHILNGVHINVLLNDYLAEVMLVLEHINDA